MVFAEIGKVYHKPSAIVNSNWAGTDPTKAPFFKGFAFLPAGSAHGTIASSLATSFASRVV
jgi:hypothetical protein